jgi:hypothetical protein
MFSRLEKLSKSSFLYKLINIEKSGGRVGRGGLYVSGSWSTGVLCAECGLIVSLPKIGALKKANNKYDKSYLSSC